MRLQEGPNLRQSALLFRKVVKERREEGDERPAQGTIQTRGLLIGRMDGARTTALQPLPANVKVKMAIRG